MIVRKPQAKVRIIKYYTIWPGAKRGDVSLCAPRPPAYRGGGGQGGGVFRAYSPLRPDMRTAGEEA